MSFHRLTTPSYYISGGWPPAGYDYINLTPGDPNQAPADGAKSGGHPSDGSYFIVFGEDATSTHANRGHKALATNCDFLDDVVSGELPVLDEQTYSNASGMGSAVITGGVFVGAFGTANNQIMRDRLILVTEKTSDKQLIVSGTAVQAALIHNGSGSNRVGQEATGFFTNPTVDFNVTIPALTDFRIVFARRSSLVSVIPSKTDIARLILTSLRSMYREIFSGGVNWADAVTNPSAPMDTQVQKMLTDLTAVTGKYGAGKISMFESGPWEDGTTIAAGNLADWVNAIPVYLARNTISGSGAGKIGIEVVNAPWTGAPHTLTVSTAVMSALVDLITYVNMPFRIYRPAGDYTCDTAQIDRTIMVQANADRIITLPVATSTWGARKITLIDELGSSEDHPITIRPQGTQKINGTNADYIVSSNFGQWELTSFGVNWFLK